MKIRLVRPTEQLKEQAINFRQEFFDNHEMVINGSELLDKIDDYEDWLKSVTNNTNIETVNPEWPLIQALKRQIPTGWSQTLFLLWMKKTRSLELLI